MRATTKAGAKRGCCVVVLEEPATWYHPSNLMKIEEKTDIREL
jgi:hypothetical protein